MHTVSITGTKVTVLRSSRFRKLGGDLCRIVIYLLRLLEALTIAQSSPTTTTTYAPVHSRLVAPRRVKPSTSHIPHS